MMKVVLAGRAAEQVVFGRVTNGAANDLEKVTEIARAMVFEFGMSESVASRTMRADNYALSEETKRLRDGEQARLTDDAYEEAVRLLEKHRARSTGSPRRCSRRRRSTARSCSRSWSDVAPSRARPRRSARSACCPSEPEADFLATLSRVRLRCSRSAARRSSHCAPTRSIQSARRRAAPASGGSASRGRRGRARRARPPSSAARCFATAWRVTGSSAASSVGGRRAARGERLEHEAPAGVGERLEDRVYAIAHAASACSSSAVATRGRLATTTRVPRRRPRAELTRRRPPSAARAPLLVDLLDRRVPLLAVPPAEDAAAARPRVELDLVREPVPEPLGLGQRLPDLLRVTGKTISRGPPSATSWLRI